MSLKDLKLFGVRPSLLCEPLTLSGGGGPAPPFWDALSPAYPQGGWERPGGKLVTRHIVYFSSATFIPVFHLSVGNWVGVGPEMPKTITPFPLGLSFPLCHVWRKGFPCFLHRGTVRIKATVLRIQPVSQRVLAPKTTQTRSLPSGGSLAVRAAGDPLTTSSWLEGRAGGAWSGNQARVRASQPQVWLH